MKKFYALLMLFGITMSMSAAVPVSGTYYIQNVGTQKYVKVTDRYYAQPNFAKDQATQIYVGVGEKLDDGTYKVTSLKGDGIEVYDYVKKAVTLAKAYVESVLTDKGDNSLSPEEVAEAKGLIDEYVNDYAYMRLQPVGDNFKAVAVIPDIPDEVEQKAAKHGVTDGVWSWAKRKAIEYFEGRGSSSTLQALLKANIDKIEPDNTYYLTAESNGTFDYTTAEPGDEGLWTLEMTTPAGEAPASGTYLIYNKGTNKFVNVISKYYAKPNETKDNATEIHVGVGEQMTDGSYKVTSLKGNGIEVYDYVEKAVRLAHAFITNYKNSAGTGLNEADLALANQYIDEYKGYAYMRVKPTGAPDEVYALATVPEVPAEVEAKFKEYSSSDKGAWDWAVRKVKEYLDTHNTDATLKAYVRANIDRIVPGTTYYLTAHATDGTFDFVAEADLTTAGDNAKWGMMIKELDPVLAESGVYFIKNKQTQQYIKITGRYYGKPDQADKANASAITVGLENQALEDGTYKVTALQGEGYDAYGYLAKAVTMAHAYVTDYFNKQKLSEEEKTTVDALIDQYAEDYGFMRVKPVIENGDTSYYALATIPEIPAKLKEIAKAHDVSDVWAWGVRKVKDYLATHGTDATLKAYVINNIDKIQPGTTYYLTSDENLTFGYATEAEVANKGNWALWQMETVNVEEGYYRIQNASSKHYVEVTEKYYARPNIENADKYTKAGTVIKVASQEGSGKLTTLRSQGVDVCEYLNGIVAVAKAAVPMVIEKMFGESDKAEIAAALGQGLVDDYSKYAYVKVESTTTEAGETAYLVKFTVPDLSEVNSYLGLAFSMGYGKGTAQKYSGYFDFDEAGNPIGLNQDAVWNKVKALINGTDQGQFSETVSALMANLPEKLRTLITANINKIDLGETYYLTEDADASFGYVKAAELGDKKDLAKWILEEVDDQDNYFAVAPAEKMAEDGKYYISLATDFAYEIKGDATAYYVKGIDKQETGKYDFAQCVPVEGKLIPAGAPVILECGSMNQEEIKLLPILDEVPAIEGNILKALFLTTTVKNAVDGEIDLMKIIKGFVEENEINLDKEPIISSENNLRVFNINSKGKVGFYKYGGTNLVGNKAFLDLDAVEGANSNAVGTVNLFFKDSATGINSVENEGMGIKNAKVYDLQGRRVWNPTKGIYIVNGKKVMVK